MNILESYKILPLQVKQKDIKLGTNVPESTEKMKLSYLSSIMSDELKIQEQTWWY